MSMKILETEDKRDIVKPIKQEKDGTYQLHDQVVHFRDGCKRYIHNVKYILQLPKFCQMYLMLSISF